MKAAYIERTGPPEVITYGDLPKPKPRENQVLVRVEAVAVNPVDTYIRSGMIPLELPKPFIIGCDLAGVVEAVGKKVRRFRPGDRVWGSNQGLLGRQGTFAEYAAVDACWLYPIPDGVSFPEAAAVALVGITAHLGLFHKAQLRADERVFVHGGSGGVGSCVVQMARAIGASVCTTAGSPQKVQICRELGANVVVNYKTEDLSAVLRQFGPVHVWYETLREPNFDVILPHMAVGGRIVIMAGRESRATLSVGDFYTRDLTIYGFAMFNAPPEVHRKAAAEINRWLRKGKLRPVIDRVLPLKEAATAHRLQEENTLRKAGTLAGKIVLLPRGRGKKASGRKAQGK